VTRAGKVLQQLTEQEPCYSRGKFRFRGLGLRGYAPLTEQEACKASQWKVPQNKTHVASSLIHTRSPPRKCGWTGLGGVRLCILRAMLTPGVYGVCSVFMVSAPVFRHHGA